MPNRYEKLNRIEYLDLAKGIVMLIVVYHHTRLIPLPVQIIYHPFFMSFFFLISGFFYSHKEPGKYFKGKAYSLLLPYVIWRTIFSVIEFARDMVRNGLTATVVTGGLKNWGLGLLAIKSPLSSGPTWFFICLFLVSAIYYFVDSIPVSNKGKACVVAGVTMVGIIINECTAIDLPFKLINALVVLPVFYFGVLVKKSSRDGKCAIFAMNRILTLLMIAVYVGLSIVHYELCGNTVSVTANVYYYYPLFYINAILGSVCVINLCGSINIGKAREKAPHVVNVIECGSIYSGVLLCIHNPVDGAFRVLFRHLPGFSTLRYFYAVIIALIVFTVLSLFAKSISRTQFRVLFGISKKKQIAQQKN